MIRIDGRRNHELRPVQITAPILEWAEGSCLIEFGKTRVHIAATVEQSVPKWLDKQRSGWITAEYSMLPRSGRSRSPRDRGQNARSLEIQRLVGRSLRAVADLNAMPGITFVLDCDVLQADGGTRTAAVTGGYVALMMALRWAKRQGLIQKIPLKDTVAGISAGIVAGELLVDLCYQEDSTAEVDMNVIMTGKGNLVEVQGTAEKTPFSKEQLIRMIEIARKSIRKLSSFQRQALAAIK